MSNVLTVPASGAIYFDSGVAGSSTVPVLTSGVSLNYDGGAGLNITSTSLTATDRFSVDGANGRLFSVSDALTGNIFSVNDAGGFPIIEVNSTTTDIVNIGTYGTNALVVNDRNVGIGTATPTAKLNILDTTLAGSGALSGSALSIAQTWNTTGTPTALKLDVTDTASNAASLLMDLQVGGISRFKVSKTGASTATRYIISDQSNTTTLYHSQGRASISANGYNGVAVVNTGDNLIACFGGTVNPWRTGVRILTFGDASGVGQTGFDGASVSLFKENTGVLAQQFGLSPQEFRLYGTYNNAVANSYERLSLKYDTVSTTFQIGTEKGSAAGIARDLVFTTDGTERVRVSTGDVTISSGGSVSINTGALSNALTLKRAGAAMFGFTHTNRVTSYQPLCPSSDNALDLGSSGTLRWRSGYFGGTVSATSLTSSGSISASGDVEITDATKGVILKSPDGLTRWRITVGNDGSLITTAVV